MTTVALAKAYRRVTALVLMLGFGCQRGEPYDVSATPNDARTDSAVSARGAASARSAASAQGAARSAQGAAPKAGGAELAPLRDARWLEPLDLGDGDSAVVSAPLGATAPRPLVVAVHGAHDRPEWACGGWRLGFAVYPFVVCPRGSPVSADKYAWGNSAAIERVILKSITKVRERFGDYVAPAPHVYAGFSQGAIFAEPILLRHAALFPTAILAEGGYPILRSRKFARSFRAAGGTTVVIVCGSPACRSATHSSVPRLEAFGLRVFESGDIRSGHNLNELMQQALLRDFKSWFAGDAVWSGPDQSP
jgi:predicted esterase